MARDRKIKEFEWRDVTSFISQRRKIIIPLTFCKETKYGWSVDHNINLYNFYLLLRISLERTFFRGAPQYNPEAGLHPEPPSVPKLSFHQPMSFERQSRPLNNWHLLVSKHFYHVDWILDNRGLYCSVKLCLVWFGSKKAITISGWLHRSH